VTSLSLIDNQKFIHPHINKPSIRTMNLTEVTWFITTGCIQCFQSCLWNNPSTWTT